MIVWLLETCLTLTILLLLVLALRGPVARAFGANWAYALWAVPALRLVLPPLPLPVPEIGLPAAVASIPAAMAGGAASLPAEAGPGQWVPLILAVWAGGAVIFLTLQWLGYRAFAQRLAGSARPARPPRHGGIATWVSDAVDGPLAMGLIERRIVVPADFSRRYSADERRLALEHELTHHRRGDIWWNVAATLVLALNWFNPIAWIAIRAFRADQELACDAAVAGRASAGERSDYARALVKSASRPGLIAACALNSASQLKRRLRMMRGHRSSPLRRTGGVVALAGLGFAGFAVGTPAVTQAAQEAPRFVTEVAAAAAARPIAAAPPAAPAPAPAAPVRTAKVKQAPRATPAPAPAPRMASASVDTIPLSTVPAAAIRAPGAREQDRGLRLVRLERSRVASGAAVQRTEIVLVDARLVHRGGLEPALARAAAERAAHERLRLADAAGALRQFHVKLVTEKGE